MKIGNADDVNKKGGFNGYGVVKNPCVLIKGSVIGTKKRLVRLNESPKPNRLRPDTPPTINT